MVFNLSTDDRIRVWDKRTFSKFTTCAVVLDRAIERALAIGALTVDAIRLLAPEGREQLAQWFNLDGRPHLQGHEIPPPHLDQYSVFLPGGGR